MRGRNFQNMLDLAKIGLQQMQHWSHQHQLALNDKKTTFLQFHTKQKQITITPLLKLNNNTITPSSNTKFLGLNIADDLDWLIHTRAISRKLRSGVFLISSLRRKVSISVLRTTYYGCFYPHMQYGILFWGCSPKSHSIFWI